MQKYTLERQILSFWNKVNKNGSIPAHCPELGACWEWTARKNRLVGYGTARLGIKTENAHRVSWRIINGEIPDGLWVLHKCDNPLCVRPDHLFLGTQIDNMTDMILKGRKAKAEGVWNCRLSTTQVNEIKERKLSGEKQNKLALEYRVSNALISYIVNNKRRI